MCIIYNQVRCYIRLIMSARARRLIEITFTCFRRVVVFLCVVYFLRAAKQRNNESNFPPFPLIYTIWCAICHGMGWENQHLRVARACNKFWATWQFDNVDNATPPRPSIPHRNNPLFANLFRFTHFETNQSLAAQSIGNASKQRSVRTTAKHMANTLDVS